MLCDSVFLFGAVLGLCGTSQWYQCEPLQESAEVAGRSGLSETENFISSPAWDLEDTPSLFSSPLLKDNFQKEIKS